MNTIKLPDGREINIRDIRNRVTNKTNHNLRTRKTTRAKGRFAPIKYTVEDRIWLATHGLEDIVARYQVTPTVAQTLKYQSRYVLDRLEIDVAEKPQTTNDK